jgi:hypothetical protein
MTGTMPGVIIVHDTLSFRLAFQNKSSLVELNQGA